MNALPYGSLSPTITFYKHPNETVVLSESVPLCVSVEAVKEELPVYDDISDVLIERKIRSSQRAIEDFLNRDTVKRERESLWTRPQRIISLPYGIHEIIEVKQQFDRDADFVITTDYTVHGLEYLSIQLDFLYPTKVRYNSGDDEVEDIFQEAVIQQTSYYFKNRNDPNEAEPTSINGLTQSTMNLLTNYVR
jgi:hypothetical protein